MANFNLMPPSGPQSTSMTPDFLNFQQPQQNDQWMTDWFGGENQAGYLSTGIGAISAGLGAYTGLQQLNLGRDQLDFQKRAYEENKANQTTLTNAALRDRQAARYSANPNAYQSPDEYMAENKVG